MTDTTTLCLVDAPAEGEEPGAVLEALRRESEMTAQVWLDRLGHTAAATPTC